MMRNRNLIIVLLVITMNSLWSTAQEKVDTVIITMPNKAALEVIGVNINKFKVDTSFITSNIELFLKFCQTSNIEEIMENQPCKFLILKMKGGLLTDSVVQVENNRKHNFKKDAYELSFEERDVPDKILATKDFECNINYLQKHQLEFKDKFFDYCIKFNDLEQVKELLGGKEIKAIDSTVNDFYGPDDKEKKGEYGRHINKLDYTINNDYSFKKVYENHKFANDQIIIAANTDLENVKNIWLANVELSLSLAFDRKGKLKNSFDFYYDWQYDFSNPQEKNINHFIGLGYSRDFSNNLNKVNVHAIKFSYLIKGDGTMFKDNTMRLGLRKNLGKYVAVEPQIYFNQFFKDVVPSVKIGFGIL